ncbi:MAG: hypothetical protein LBP24_02770 [Coriobacteriales bacterium]|jgi:hypothetical protein|nr:hypothetical protein [Coriobacteriales bacterium]
MAEITESTESYWKKPGPQEQGAQKQDFNLGPWSRSRALRIVVWISVIALTLFFALATSAYLSGFDSAAEMLSWLRESLTQL